MMVTMGLVVRTSLSFLLMVFLIQSWTLAFKFFTFRSVTHEAITRVAILETTFDLCKSQALREGRNFETPNLLTEESLAAACSSAASAKAFKRSIEKINGRNAWVDVRHVSDPKYHFGDESFFRGRELITSGVRIVKASVKQQSYEAARAKLGEVLHTLQDFYSHSNWIELGNRRPFSNLIKPSSPIDNIADSATCRNCTGNNCTGNILEEIYKKRQLTSGYFNMFNSSKPAGKCSHGGSFDLTSLREPKGGISKDTVDSEHGFLHTKAVEVAIAATRELLEDISAGVGDSEFLRLMGLTQTSVLCFVIDTTGSMSDDIAEVRRVTSSIIDRKAGKKNQPSEYILVPFNDPDFGPLTRTTDPHVFKSKINALTAEGGGDRPEMCLSGLQLALTGSPPQTEIFVFTDADAKDTWLKSTVLALIERTKSVVTKATLPQATSIIVDTSSSSLVTVFQAVRNPAKAETFSFFVDSTLQNLTVYITGNSPYYIISSPSGVSQTSVEPSGALGMIETVGNFYTVRLTTSDQAGLWLISINSTQPYTVKVLGQSAVDFLFDFVELSDGPHPSYAVLNSRPAANSNVTLLVSMVGGDSVTPTEVALVEASSSKSYNGTLKEVALGMFMASINSVPAGEFVVRVAGKNIFSKASNGLFQRQSSTQLQASNVSITTQADGILVPGKNFTLTFTVATTGSGGVFNIRVSNDRSFIMTNVPSSLTLVRGGSANGTVTLAAPRNTTSGSDVTLTIEAETPGGADSNYAVLRLSVVALVTDITPPVCEVVSVNANCLGDCMLSFWDLSANMTDGNGSGIQSVTIRQGNGSLSTSTVPDRGVNVTQAFYSASCCFPKVELMVVDAVGNVGTCFRSLNVTVSQSTNATSTMTTINNNNGAECCLFLPVFFWLTVGTSLFYQYMQL
ncbi:hypothetical protein MHYP_G00043940 [Metynnis hypsauchen]